MSSDTPLIRGISTNCQPVLWAIFVLLLCGCASQQAHIEQDFPPELITRARADFDVDITDWDVSTEPAVPKCISLGLNCEPGIDSAVRDFCRQKLENYLAAIGIEIAPEKPAQLLVYIVKASQVRKPVRSAKVRIAAKLSTGPTSDDIVLIGIADGIVPRPDLSSNVSIPKSSYLRATQFAVSKLMQQVSTIPQTE